MILIFLSNVFLPNQTFFCVSTEAQRVKLHFFSFFFLVIHFLKIYFYLVWSSLGSKHRKQKLHIKQILYEKYFILLKRFILFLSSSNFLKMFFSLLCFTQKTLKTFLSTHIKKIHGNFLFPTERKKIPQPSQSS